MAARSIWNGTITFGIVNVPVKLYTATESKSVHFHQVHARDGSPVENRRICSKEDKEVPYKQVVKGYEVSENRYVVLEPDEVKAAAGDRGKIVHLKEFIDVATTTSTSRIRMYRSRKAWEFSRSTETAAPS